MEKESIILKQKSSDIKDRVELIELEKMAAIGKLVSGMAHEINNSLLGIITYSGILREDLKNTKFADDIEIVNTEALRCRELVSWLLDFSKKTDSSFKQFNLNELVTETVTMLQKIHDFGNVIVGKDLDSNIPLMEMDVNQMRSIINNLVLNSVDAMPNGGNLKLITGYNEQSKNVILIVEDSGIGIKKENLKLIFEPFFTAKEAVKGTGLGLFVTYNIVERHKGQIKAESVEGVGTTFTVELPVKEQKVEPI